VSGIGLRVDEELEAVDGGEAKDGVVGDGESEGVGDEDGLLEGVCVGRLVADESGEKAMFGGVEGGGVKEGTAQLNGFEGVVAIKELNRMNRRGMARSKPEVKREVASVQPATGVKEGAEGEGGGESGAEIELNMQEVVVYNDGHGRACRGAGVKGRSGGGIEAGTAHLSWRRRGGMGGSVGKGDPGGCSKDSFGWGRERRIQRRSGHAVGVALEL
jgi:hypothetical protein